MLEDSSSTFFKEIHKTIFDLLWTLIQTQRLPMLMKTSLARTTSVSQGSSSPSAFLRSPVAHRSLCPLRWRRSPASVARRSFRLRPRPLAPRHLPLPRAPALFMIAWFLGFFARSQLVLPLLLRVRLLPDALLLIVQISAWIVSLALVGLRGSLPLALVFRVLMLACWGWP